MPRPDRSACIWCSRMVVVPAMACSRRSAAEQALHRSMETDELCRSGLIGRLKSRSTAASRDMVAQPAAPRRTAVSGRMGVCAHNFAAPSGVAAGPGRYPGRTLRPDPPFQGAGGLCADNWVRPHCAAAHHQHLRRGPWPRGLAFGTLAHGGLALGGRSGVFMIRSNAIWDCRARRIWQACPGRSGERLLAWHVSVLYQPAEPLTLVRAVGRLVSH